MKNKKILLSVIPSLSLPLIVCSCSNEVQKEQKTETEDDKKIREFYNLNLENIADLKNNWKIDFIQLNSEQNREIFANNESKIIFFKEKSKEKEIKSKKPEENINVIKKEEYSFSNKKENIETKIEDYDFALEIKLLNKDYLKNKINLKFNKSKNLILVNFYRKVISDLKDPRTEYHHLITSNIPSPKIDFSKYQNLVSSEVKFNSLNFNKDKVNVIINIDKNKKQSDTMINLFNQNYYFNVKTTLAEKWNLYGTHFNNTEATIYEPHGVSKKYVLKEWRFHRLVQYSFIVPANISKEEYKSIKDINLTFNDNAKVT
ncbi:hypothetical protein [Mycoplasma sp. 1012]